MFGTFWLLLLISYFPLYAVAETICENPESLEYEGTVRDSDNFDAKSDATEIERLINVEHIWPANKTDLVNVVCRRSSSQRQVIRSQFKEKFGKDLVEELGQKFDDQFAFMMKGLFKTTLEFETSYLRSCLMHENDSFITDFMTSRNESELAAVRTSYERMYGISLGLDIVNRLDGDFEDLILLLEQGQRFKDKCTNEQFAELDASNLFATTTKWPVVTEWFLKILANNNRNQLKRVLTLLPNYSNRADVFHLIRHYFIGRMTRTLSALANQALFGVRWYLAKKLNFDLYKDPFNLIATIISRAEIDLVQIKQEFIAIHNVTVSEAMTNYATNQYHITMCLMNLIGE